MTRYKNQKQVKNFIKTLTSDPIADLSVYTDPTFAANLRLMALEDMHYLLNKIIHTKPLDIQKMINCTYPETKLNLIDYCAIAGLTDMAEKLLVLGAKSKCVVHLDKIFSDKFDRESETPEIINDIQQTIEMINSDQTQIQEPSPAPSIYTDTWKQLKILCMQHKVPAFFLIFGLSCSLASPAAPATTGTILLLSFGIPSILAGMKYCQDAYKARVDSGQAEEQKRITEQEQEIKDLIKCIEDTKRDIKVELKRNGLKNYNTSTRSKEFHTQPDPEQILFDFQSKTEANGGEDNNGAAALHLKLKLAKDQTTY